MIHTEYNAFYSVIFIILIYLVQIILMLIIVLVKKIHVRMVNTLINNIPSSMSA